MPITISAQNAIHLRSVSSPKHPLLSIMVQAITAQTIEALLAATAVKTRTEK